MVTDKDRQNYRVSWSIIDCDGDHLGSYVWVLLTSQEALRLRQLMGLGGKSDIKVAPSDEQPPHFSGLPAICRHIGIKSK